MVQVIYSLSSSTLKLSTAINGQLLTVSQQLESFEPDYIQATATQLLEKVLPAGKKHAELVCIVEPSDTYLNFVIINKGRGNLEEQIISETKEKLVGINLEDVYFSYQKLAPFVYQTIAISKERVDSYLSVANMLGIPLKAILPWVLLLPKFVNSSAPMIFVSKDGAKQVVALSELGGLFFVGTYEHEKTNEELQKLVEDLSVYKRSDDPITKIYTFNYDNFTLETKYELIKLNTPLLDLEEYVDFEKHALVRDALIQKSDLLESYLNLLNMLPVPEVQKKNTAIYVGSGLAVALLLVGGFFVWKASDTSTLDQADVLSQETSVVEQPEEKPEATVETELKSSDLKIRVENGSKISGMASKTQGILEDLGYVVDSIGDASVSGNSATFIKFKSDKEQYQDLLLKDLENKIDPVATSDLSSDENYDVLIILGTDLSL